MKKSEHCERLINLIYFLIPPPQYFIRHHNEEQEQVQVKELQLVLFIIVCIKAPFGYT
jgi:hypothetical protein